MRFQKERRSIGTPSQRTTPSDIPRVIQSLVVLPGAVLALFVELPLLLPSLSLMLLGIAALVATAAWITEVNRDQADFTLWDIAGAYALVGFIAGTLSEPEQTMALSALPVGTQM